jgi:hypothetical protein
MEEASVAVPLFAIDTFPSTPRLRAGASGVNLSLVSPAYGSTAPQASQADGRQKRVVSGVDAHFEQFMVRCGPAACAAVVAVPLFSRDSRSA